MACPCLMASKGQWDIQTPTALSRPTMGRTSISRIRAIRTRQAVLRRRAISRPCSKTRMRSIRAARRIRAILPSSLEHSPLSRSKMGQSREKDLLNSKERVKRAGKPAFFYGLLRKSEREIAGMKKRIRQAADPFFIWPRLEALFFIQESREILDGHANLLHGIAIPNGNAAVVQRLKIDGDAIGRADLVLAAVALADAA